jgi:hypothetical protein
MLPSWSSHRGSQHRRPSRSAAPCSGHPGAPHCSVPSPETPSLRRPPSSASLREAPPRAPKAPSSTIAKAEPTPMLSASRHLADPDTECLWCRACLEVLLHWDSCFLLSLAPHHHGSIQLGQVAFLLLLIIRNSPQVHSHPKLVQYTFSTLLPG